MTVTLEPNFVEEYDRLKKKIRPFEDVIEAKKQ
jgi:hypothetical protein